MNEILHGDCFEILPTLPESSIDAMITDPPYGASFMGKQWDRAVPSVDIWRECLRVMKPGAFAFVMSLPRQDCLARMIVNLEDAGFVVAFSPIFWCFATGFPKASNIGKVVDKRAGAKREIIQTIKKTHIDGRNGHEGWQRPSHYDESGEIKRTMNITAPATPQAQAFDGAYAGFQPKPAAEMVLVAMKPLEGKTYVEQALKNGKGVTWLDDGRIPLQGIEDHNTPGCRNSAYMQMKDGVNQLQAERAATGENPRYSQQGRFPANLLIEDNILIDDKDHSHGAFPKKSQGAFYGRYAACKGEARTLTDSGSFSRYFDLDAWFADRIALLPEAAQKTFPYLIVPKPSRREKNMGLAENEGATVNNGRQTPIDNPFQRGETVRQNTHPTVKPIKLMSWLLTIGSRPDDVILDPFCGSGTTALACKLNHRQFVAIEREEEYCHLARARVAAIDEPQPDLLEAAA